MTVRDDYLAEGTVSGFRVRFYADGRDGLLWLWEAAWLRVVVLIPIRTLREFHKALDKGESYWSQWERGGLTFAMELSRYGIWFVAGRAQLQILCENDEREALRGLVAAVLRSEPAVEDGA